MTDAPNARTLRDYTHFVRRHLWVFLGSILVVVAISVALSLAQPKRYTATAKLYFPDPLAQAGIVGEQASNTPPAQLAAQGAPLLTSATTLRTVRGSLRTQLSIDQLKNDVTTVTDPTTFVVTVTATTPSPALTANLVNAVVLQAKARADAAAQRQFAQVARSFLIQIHGLTPAQRNNQAIVSGLYDNYSRAFALSHGGAVAAQIQSLATLPTSPSSPKPVSAGVVGAVLGIVLGLIIAGVLETFDRRLRDPAAIEADLQLPILAQIREQALGRPPLAINGGPGVDDLDLEAFRILRTNIALVGPDGPPRIVAVTSALPEEGKTTVASSLAFALALGGQRTLLVECDLRRPTLSTRLGLKKSPGLSDFLTGAADRRDVVQVIPGYPRNVGESGINGSGDPSAADGSGGFLACITAGSRTDRPSELLASQPFRQFLAEVAQVYDAVVLDTAPLLPVADTLQLLPNADAYLVCLRASRTTRDQALAARAAVARLPEKPGGVVLTGARDRHDYGGYYSYAHSDA